MAHTFTNEDISAISAVLDSKPQEFDNSWSWRVHNPHINQTLVLSIHNNIHLGTEKVGTLISIQTQHGYFEMHDCTAYMLFEPDEIIFVQAGDTNVSSLIIGKLATCSLYSNISRDIINADLNNLDPVVLLSAMQLSLTETLL